MMMDAVPSVYIASKLRHAGAIKAWVREWTQASCTSSWLDIVGDVPDDAANAKVFWSRNFRDIMSADFLLVYAEPDDKLRGALVEVGFAIAQGKPVITVGEHPDFGTWQYSGMIYRASDRRQASWFIKHLSGG